MMQKIFNQRFPRDGHLAGDGLQRSLEFLQDEQVQFLSTKLSTKFSDEFDEKKFFEALQVQDQDVDCFKCPINSSFLYAVLISPSTGWVRVTI